MRWRLLFLICLGHFLNFSAQAKSYENYIILSGECVEITDNNLNAPAQAAVCMEDAPFLLDGDTPSSAYEIFYQWQAKENDLAGWFDVDSLLGGENENLMTLDFASAGTIEYRRLAFIDFGVCDVADTSNVVAIQIDFKPTNTITPGSYAIVCFDPAGSLLIDGSIVHASDSAYQWQYRENTIDGWFDLDSVEGGNDEDFTINGFYTADTLEYRRMVTSSNGCMLLDSSSILTLYILDSLTVNLASVDHNGTFCVGEEIELDLDFTGAPPFAISISDGDSIYDFTVSGMDTLINLPILNVSLSNESNFQLTHASNGLGACVGNISGINDVLVNVHDSIGVVFSFMDSTICLGSNIGLELDFSLPGNYEVVYNDGLQDHSFFNSTDPDYISLSPLDTTTYSLVSIRQVDAPGCTYQLQELDAVIKVKTPPSANISGDTTICAGGEATLTFDLTGVGPFDVVYETPSGSQVALDNIANGHEIEVSPVETGTYTLVSVSDNQHPICSGSVGGSASVTVVENPLATISGNATICPSGTTDITFNISGGGNFNVSYSDGIDTFAIGPIASGADVAVSPSANTTYTLVSVTSTDFPFCNGSITGSAIVNINVPVDASISGSQDICLGDSGNVTFSFSDLSAYNVELSDGTDTVEINNVTNNATHSVSPSVNTVYTLTSVTKASSPFCEGNIIGSPVSIEVNSLPSASISGDATICEGDSTALSIVLSGTGPFDVVYFDGTSNYNLNDITNGHTFYISPSTNTSYSLVSVEDANNPVCAGGVSGQADIIVNELPEAIISGTATICQGDSTLLSLSLSGAGPFDVEYSNSVDTFNLNNISNGHTFYVSPNTSTTYTLISIKDSNSPVCLGAVSGLATITVNSLATGSLSAQSDLCKGTSTNLTFTLSGTGPFDVTYSDGFAETTINNMVNGQTVAVSPNDTTTYTIVSIIDNHTPACEVVNQDSVTINVFQPMAEIQGSATICEGDATNITLQIAGLGPFDVVYSDGTNQFPLNGIADGHSFSVSPSTNTTYSLVSVEDQSETTCTYQLGASIDIDVIPIYNASISGTTTICPGDDTDLSIAISSAGLYEVVYTDGTDDFTLNNISNGQIINVSPSASTEYELVSVTRESAPLCAAVLGASAIVTINPTVQASITGSQDICTGSSGNITFHFNDSDNYDISLSDGTNTINLADVSDNDTYSVSPTVNTTYTLVSVTESGNPSCEGNIVGSPVSIEVNSLPIASLSGTATICDGDDTQLLFTLSGQGPFDVVYTDGTFNYPLNDIINGHTLDVSPSATTTYSLVSVADSNTPSCSGSVLGQATITVNQLPTAILSGTSAICVGESATLTIDITGTGPFDVVYTDGTNQFNLNNIADGHSFLVNPSINTSYSLISVSDNQTPTCLGAISGLATITINALPGGSLSATSAICEGVTTDLTFNLTGTGPFDVSYTDGTDQFDIENILNGYSVPVSPVVNTTYTLLSVTDNQAHACSVSPASSVSISVGKPEAELTGTTSICVGESATLTFHSEGVGPYNVVYSNGSTQFDLDNIADGHTFQVSPLFSRTYSLVSVEDLGQVGCNHILGQSAIVTVIPAYTASISGNNTICLGTSSNLTFSISAAGSYNLIYTDGTSQFSVNGISNGHQIAVNPTVTTSYELVSVEMDNAPFCDATLSGEAVVTVNQPVQASITGSEDLCNGESADLTFNFSDSGTYNVTYSNGTNTFNLSNISDGHVQVVTPTVSTTYTLISVQEAASPNCSGNVVGSSVIVQVRNLPTAAISGSKTICLGSSTNLTFTLTGTGPFDVSYSDGNTIFDLLDISSGHTVSVSPSQNTSYSLVSVADSNNPVCAGTLSGTAIINVNQLPTANISGDAEICIGESTNITFTFTGVGPFDVVLSDGVNTNQLNNISSGFTLPVSPLSNKTYTLVSVNDSQNPNCNGSISGSATVVVRPLPNAVISGSTTICIGNEASLQFTFTGTGPFDVVYSDGFQNFSETSVGNTLAVQVSPSVNTTYSLVSVTDLYCSKNVIGSTTIFVNPLPTASISGSTVLCNGESTQILFSLSGSGPFDVTYSDGSNQFILNNISNGHTISVSPSQNTNYTIVSVSDNQSPSCNATISGNAFVVVNTLPTASISGGGLICQGSQAAIQFAFQGIGPFDVVYTDGQNNFNLVNIGVNHTVQVSPSDTRTYTLVSVQDNNTPSCFANLSGSALVEIETPTSGEIVGDNNICEGEFADIVFHLTGVAPFDVVYTDGTSDVALNNILDGHTVSVSPETSVNFTLISVKGNGNLVCNGNVLGGAEINVIPALLASISGDHIICEGGSVNLEITLEGEAPWSVVITDGESDFVFNDIQTSLFEANVSPLQTSVYTIKSIEDGLGVDCGFFTGSASVSVDQPLQNNVLETPDPASFCGSSPGFQIIGGQPSGGNGVFTYLWERKLNNGLWTAVGTQKNLTEAPNANLGTYYYRRSVFSGLCESMSDEVVVKIAPNITNNVVEEPEQSLFCIVPDQIVFNGNVPNGADENTVFLWQRSDNQGSSWIDKTFGKDFTENTLVEAGIYQFRRIVNSETCQEDNTSNIIVIEIIPVVEDNVVEQPTQTVFCGVVSDLTVVGRAAVVSTNFGYQWQRFQNNAWANVANATGQNLVFSSTQLGIYNFRRALSYNNCIDYSNTVTLRIEPSPVISITEITPSVENKNSGGAKVSIAGGLAPYQYLWSNGSKAANLVGVGPGNYTLLVTDQNNCTDLETFSVSEVLGIGDILSSGEIELYPNPVHQTLTLELQNLPLDPIEIKIVDLAGKLVWVSERMRLDNLETAINVGSLRSGVYILMIQERDKVFRTRFVKE